MMWKHEALRRLVEMHETHDSPKPLKYEVIYKKYKKVYRGIARLSRPEQIYEGTTVVLVWIEDTHETWLVAGDEGMNTLIEYYRDWDAALECRFTRLKSVDKNVLSL